MTDAPRANPVRPRNLSAAGVAVILVAAYAGILVSVPRRDRQLAPDAARLRLDPNTATAAELVLLDHVGPTLAANIISYRSSADARPAFRRLEDLDAVYRIGPITLQRIAPELTFPDVEPPATAEETAPHD